MKPSVRELLVVHNLRATATGQRPLVGWKSGKDKLLARIEALPKIKTDKKPVAAKNDLADYEATIAAIGVSARDTIQVASEKLLEATAYEHDGRKWGIPYDVVLTEIRRVFPDCRTTVACLRWYAVRMNEVGTRLPKRKRSFRP
jgi:hypothetical protein